MLEQLSNSIKVRKSTLSLSSIPWDTINIIIDFTPKALYPMLRLNKSLTRLVQKRLIGLTFKLSDITEQTFVSTLSKDLTSLKSLCFFANLKQVKKTTFDKFPFRAPNLISLELISLNIISDTTLTKILTLCNHSLKKFRVSYRC